MAETISPEKQTVETCLKNRTYYIDFYQREYVWNKETVDTLLNDIFYAFELSYNNYKDAELTQEILEKFNWYYLNVYITNNISGRVYIVDGQQRLTTLTLIAVKLYHLVNDEFLKDNLKECILGKDKWKGNIYRIDNEKRKCVMDVLMQNLPYPCVFNNKTEENLINRYQDISKYIDDKKLCDNALDAFVRYFLERLVIVELTITKDDTPMVFEVINDRGEALKPFEILKGKLIGALDKNDTDSYSEQWDKTVNSLNNIADLFFADYLKSKFVFTRNSKLEASINNEYHRYIFEDNDIADKLSFRKSDQKHIKNIKSFVENDVVYYGRLYSKIKCNDNEFLKYDNEILQLSGQYEIILAACELNDFDEDRKICDVAKEYERLFVLLQLNGIYDSNQLQEISYNLNEKIRGLSVDSYRRVFNEIITNSIKERRGLNTDVELLNYNTFLKADYSNLNTRFLRYFLARIEQYICKNTKQSMQNDVEYISTRTGYKSGYHIEHILSHNETNIAYFTSEEEFESKRNQLGGLLLLKDRDNISSGNEEYADKLKTYSSGLVWGHTLCDDFYHKNKDFDDFNSDLKTRCGHSFSPIQMFDSTALEQRNRLLYELVKIIWEV
jgi:uncharacterized protein with ParB-like and HNH nuclease domain